MQVTPPPPPFVRVIQRARVWLMSWHSVQCLARGLVVGSGVVLAVVVASKLALAQSSPWIAPAAGMLGLLMVLLWSLLRQGRPTSSEAARQLDDALGTKEVFLTAHGFRAGQLDGSGAFGRLVEARANQLAGQFPISRLGRPTLGPTLGLVALLLLTAGMLDRFVPYLDGLGGGRKLQQVQKHRRVLEVEAKKLDQVAQSLKSPLNPMTPKDTLSSGTAAAAQAIEALRRSLTDQRDVPDTKEALAKLSSVTDRMEKQRQEAQQQGQVGIDRETSDSLASSQARAAAGLERALRRGNMERAKEELNRLEQQATSTDRSPEDRKSVGQELRALSERIHGQQGLSGALGSLAEAAMEGNPQAGQQAAAEVRRELDRIAAAQAEARQLAAALDGLQGTRENLAEAGQQAGEGSPDGQQMADASGNAPGQTGNGTTGDNQPNGSQAGNSGSEGQGSSSSSGSGNENRGTAGSPGGESRSGSGTPGNSASSTPGQAGSNPSAGASSGNPGESGNSGNPGASGDQSASSGGQNSPSNAGSESSGTGSPSSGDGGPGPGQFEIGSGSSSTPSSGGNSGSPNGGNESGGQSGDAGQDGQQSGESSGQPNQAGESSGAAGSQAGGSQSGGSQASGSQSGGSQGSTAQAGGSQSGGSQGASAMGSGGAAGAGNPSPGWGVGTTNLDAGRGAVPAARAGENRQADGRRSNWTEDFIRLYDPKANSTKGRTERAGARLGEGQFTGSLEVKGSPREEKAQTETSRAFLDWRETNRNSQAAESIPKGYRDFVKGYFDSIEPPQPASKP